MSKHGLLPEWKPTKDIVDWSSGWQFEESTLFQKYLDYVVTPGDIVSVAHLLFPSFCEYKGGVFLEMNFSEESVDDFISGGYDLGAVEGVINHVHVYDFFMNEELLCDDDCETIAEILSTAWACCLKLQFPNRSFTVEWSHTDQDYGPTVYITRNVDK
jgi:hypothetical protein